MSKKPRTQFEIFNQWIKETHPIYQGYVIDLLRKSIADIEETLPTLVEQEKENQTLGRISLFHPNFYVDFINEMNQVFDKIDLYFVEKYNPEKVSEFKKKEKINRIEI